MNRGHDPLDEAGNPLPHRPATNNRAISREGVAKNRKQ